MATNDNPTLIPHRDTNAGWVGPDVKEKLKLDPAQMYARVEFENSQLSKAQLEQAITDGLTMEVKKYRGPVSLFKPTGIAHADSFKVVLAGERVKA